MPSAVGSWIPVLMAWAVGVLHVVFIAFMLTAPFSSNRTLLATHVVVTPFLWLHWWLNDDTCALTIVEKKLRGISDDDKSFVHALVSPVYKIRDADVRVASWYASITLWLVAVARVTWEDVRTAFWPF